MILVPLVLVILPPDFFDKGHSTCISVILLRKTCPGCGITRAIQHLIHLDFRTAFEYNKLCIIVFPLLVYFWITEFIKIFRKVKAMNRTGKDVI